MVQHRFVGEGTAAKLVADAVKAAVAAEVVKATKASVRCFGGTHLRLQ